MHEDLEEEVYMEVPLVLLAKGQRKVCKLKKAFYGLKQPPRAWFDKFSKIVVSFGTNKVTQITLGSLNIAMVRPRLSLYMFDDIVVTRNDSEEITLLKVYLAQRFEIKGKL